MRKTAVAVLLALCVTGIAHGSDINRVKKYLWDNGQSNAVFMVDFNLRDDSDGKGVYIDGWAYTNIAKPKLSDCPSDAVAEAWALAKWQTDKPVMLKIVENVYVSFLTNDWTTVLRTYSLIQSNFVVTVTNKSETENVTYLLYLKSLSKPDYYNMAGEFDRYKATIVGYGGIMSEVIWHQEVAQ